MKTIEISLLGNDTSANIEMSSSLKRLINISLKKNSFVADANDKTRSISVSFGTLPSSIQWNDIV